MTDRSDKLVMERDRYQSDPRVKMLSTARQRAKKIGIKFDLVLDDIKIPAFCPLLGIPLSLGNGVMADSSPSLDRIRNNVGYIRGNVIIISWAANRCKGRLQADDILKLAKNLKALEKGLI
jgi:hypothetical protein